MLRIYMNIDQKGSANGKTGSAIINYLWAVDNGQFFIVCAIRVRSLVHLL